MLKKDRSEIYLSFDVNGKHLLSTAFNRLDYYDNYAFVINLHQENIFHLFIFFKKI